MQIKSQSAIEFMMTYGFVFLIIAIFLAVLLLFSSFPKYALPTQCVIYGGISCQDAILTTGAPYPYLILSISPTSPGVLNISNFSATVGFKNSVTGFCRPSYIDAGAQAYCIATFNSLVPKSGNQYSGTFHINGNYCAAGSGNVSNVNCNGAGGQYSYGGSLSVQASVINASNTIPYVPIKITNSQSSPTSANFQQMISVHPATYNAYERSDLGNIRFYLGGKELYSWCESNCTSSSSSNAIFWIAMPSTIQPSTNLTVNMYFMSHPIDYDGIYAGEAPQLSASYAKYDNGAKIFPFYDNFAGSTLKSSWSSTGSITTATGNGLSLTNTNHGWYGLINSYVVPVNTIIETGFLTAASVSSEAILIGVASSGIGFSGNYITGQNRVDAVPSHYWGIYSTSSSCATGTFSYNTPSVMTLYDVNNPYLQANYTAICTETPQSPVSSHLVLATYFAQPATFYWIRTRTYPPNAIMPSTSFGGIT